MGYTVTRRAILRTGIVDHEVFAAGDCDRVDWARIQYAADVFFSGPLPPGFRTGFFWADVGDDGNLEIGSRLTEAEILTLRTETNHAR
jgi:hypothetical protein